MGLYKNFRSKNKNIRGGEYLKVDDVVMKGFGFWLLAIVEAIIIFASYFIGHAANGLDPVFVSMIITILMSSEILLVLLIRHYFKIPDESKD